MNKTKIMVINSQPLLKAKIRQALNWLDNAEILDYAPGEAGNNIITQIAANSPDIVLLDIGFPQLKGLESADKIALVYPSVAVIMLSANPAEDDDEIFEAIKCGAVAYLREKQSYSSVIIDTIKQVCEGKLPITKAVVDRPKLARRILRQFQDMALPEGSKNDIIIPLTIEEEEILKLIALKNSRQQIASVLGFSDEMVNNRVNNIQRKLATNDRAYRLFSKVRKDLISVRIAKYGNLLILNSTASSCDFQPLPASLHRT